MPWKWVQEGQNGRDVQGMWQTMKSQQFLGNRPALSLIVSLVVSHDPLLPVSSVEQVLPVACLRPRSCSRSPLPKGATGRPRSVRSVSTHRRSGSPAFAAGRGEQKSAACATSASAPSEPRAVVADPVASAAGLSSRGRPSGAAEAWRRKRDKHRRRVRQHSKRSMWREIWCQVFARLAMGPCCADSSSDGDTLAVTAT